VDAVSGDLATAAVRTLLKSTQFDGGAGGGSGGGRFQQLDWARDMGGGSGGTFG